MAAGRRRTRDRAGPASGRLAERCGREAVAVLRRLLGDGLAGVYLVGSGALGGFAPDQSDVDVVAVCAAPLPPDAKRALVDALGERAMTWPVRGLEFVLYARAAVARPAPAPRFEINLNVGRRMPYRVSLDPTRDPAHWFVLDLAILRDHGHPLAGPPPRDLVAPIPRPRLLAALRDSLSWHLAHESALHQSVLNACRGWRWTDEGIWSSKDAAAAWAHPRASDPDLVEAALAIRHGDPRTLDPARVAAFQLAVLERVERALGSDRGM